MLTAYLMMKLLQQQDTICDGAGVAGGVIVFLIIAFLLVKWLSDLK